MDVYYELEAEKLINAGENVSNLQYIHPKHTMGHIYKAANLTFNKHSMKVNLPGVCVLNYCD